MINFYLPLYWKDKSKNTDKVYLLTLGVEYPDGVTPSYRVHGMYGRRSALDHWRLRGRPERCLSQGPTLIVTNTYSEARAMFDGLAVDKCTKGYTTNPDGVTGQEIVPLDVLMSNPQAFASGNIPQPPQHEANKARRITTTLPVALPVQQTPPLDGKAKTSIPDMALSVLKSIDTARMLDPTAMWHGFLNTADEDDLDDATRILQGFGAYIRLKLSVLGLLEKELSEKPKEENPFARRRTLEF